MYRCYLWVLLLAFFRITDTSYCGESAIPYSVEVLENGELILGCNRPACFGFGPSGRPDPDDTSFNKTGYGISDGFLKQTVAKIKSYGKGDSRYHTPYKAACQADYSAESCVAQVEWVGGIARQDNSSKPLQLRCCTFYSLTDSTDRGIADVRPGQIVEGGTASDKRGAQKYYDYISNIAKKVDKAKRTYYEVSMRRMLCAPPPTTSNSKGRPDVLFQARTVGADVPVQIGETIEKTLVNNQAAAAGEEADQSANRGGTKTGGKTRLTSNTAKSESIEDVGFDDQDDDLTEGTVEEAVLEEIFVDDGVQLLPGAGSRAGGGGGFVQQSAAGAGSNSFTFRQLPPTFRQLPTVMKDDQQCFTGDMLVEMSGRRKKRMDKLKRGDWVLAVNNDGQMMYQPINYFIHRLPSQKAIFHDIELTNGNHIKLTSRHFIYKGDCSNLNKVVSYGQIPDEPVFAKDVVAGDCLFEISNNANIFTEYQVRSVRLVNETGIYSPMTNSGTIVVNNIYASCLSEINSHSIFNSIFEVMHGFKDAFEWALGSKEIDQAVAEEDLPFGLSMLINIQDVINSNSLFS